MSSADDDDQRRWTSSPEGESISIRLHEWSGLDWICTMAGDWWNCLAGSECGYDWIDACMRITCTHTLSMDID